MIRTSRATCALSAHVAPQSGIVRPEARTPTGRYGRAVHPVAAVIAEALEAQAPADLVVARHVPVHFPTGLVRTPDLVVAGALRPRFTPGEVLLAVEVEPTVDDRTSSPAVYGEHGVPHVWRVTPEPPTIRVFALRDGVHQQVAASAHVLAHAPFRLAVDLTGAPR
ncbi:Uma2 family endonuclease [Actinomycetospora sp. CA-084318]|uniref:Uma2 family endonuclease n=1 Tax=Actinomycetospora sp. CA-084318 TaxID=3239892 RepID=UPI003D99614E